MARDRRPIIHVGLAKCGSTWLQRHGLPTIAGLDVLTVKTSTVLIRQVHQHLYSSDGHPAADDVRRHVDGVDGTPLLSNENFASPWSWSPDHGLRIADRLSGLFPDAKILLVVREQAAMISSLYAQYVKEGGYVGFQRFVEGDAPHSRFDVDWLQYHRHVEAFHTRFDAPDVLVLTYEHLRSDPRSFLAAVAAFADLSYDGEPDDGRRVNPTPSRYALAGLRAVNRLVRASPRNPSPALFRLPNASRARGVAQMFPAPSTIGALGRGDAARASTLARRCAESNRRLTQLAGVDLHRWGYEVSDVETAQLTDAR